MWLYLIISDKYCEQGGQATIPTEKELTITFKKAFKNTYYNMSISAYWSSSATAQNEGVQRISATQMKVTSSYAPVPCNWSACGYIS